MLTPEAMKAVFPLLTIQNSLHPFKSGSSRKINPLLNAYHRLVGNRE